MMPEDIINTSASCHKKCQEKQAKNPGIEFRSHQVVFFGSLIRFLLIKYWIGHQYPAIFFLMSQHFRPGALSYGYA
jgi:hypothetical protein